MLANLTLIGWGGVGVSVVVTVTVISFSTATVETAVAVTVLTTVSPTTLVTTFSGAVIGPTANAPTTKPIISAITDRAAARLLEIPDLDLVYGIA
jgi:hypothetical protein